ncbi:KilA-N domain protein [compost metagenome]
MNTIIPYDYEGQLVRFKSDGWIDATSAAKHYGKEVHEWLRSIDTLELLLILADDLFGESVNSTGLEPASQSDPSSKTGNFPVLEKLRRMKPGGREARNLTQEIIRSSGLVDARRGRHGGTWLHPDLGVHYAYWLDKKFAVWVGRRIVELLRGQTVALSGPVEFDVWALFGQQVEQMLSGATSGATA